MSDQVAAQRTAIELVRAAFEDAGLTLEQKREASHYLLGYVASAVPVLVLAEGIASAVDHVTTARVAS